VSKHLPFQLFNLRGLQSEQDIALQQVEQARAFYFRILIQRIENLGELSVVIKRDNLGHHQILLEASEKLEICLVSSVLPVVEFVVLFLFRCFDNFHVVHVEQHP